MTHMISAMKLVKDRMDDPVPLAEVNQYLDVLKSTGTESVEVASVIGHPNFALASKLWADAIHAKELKVTWRCAHQNMEGLYGAQKYVGALRKPEQFWIDEAVNAFNSIKDSIEAGDEEAIYPERTEGIFQDATSFLPPAGLPGSYGAFFTNLHNALKVFPWTTGLSANNASELMSGWMPNFFSVAVIDHYVDGDPVKFEADVRAIKAKYGKPVYVQEGAPNRFTLPTAQQITDYIAVLKRLEADNVLYGFGAWSGWAGTPEAALKKVDGVWSLNEYGEALKAWWNPAPISPPAENGLPAQAVASMEVLRQASVITFKTGQTLTAKVNELKVLLGKPIV